MRHLCEGGGIGYSWFLRYSSPPSVFSVGQGVAYKGYGIIPSLIWDARLILPVTQGAQIGRKTLPKQTNPSEAQDSR